MKLAAVFLSIYFALNFAVSVAKNSNKAYFQNDDDTKVCFRIKLLGQKETWANVQHKYSDDLYFVECIKDHNRKMFSEELTYEGNTDTKVKVFRSQSEKLEELDLPHFFKFSQPVFHKGHVFYVGFNKPKFLAIKFNLSKRKIVKKIKIASRKIEEDDISKFPFAIEERGRIKFTGADNQSPVYMMPN